MAGADSLAGVAVEVFVEGDGVALVRIGLELFDVAEDGAAFVGAAQEDAREAAGDFGGDFPKVHHLARAGRAFYFEVVAVVVMELLNLTSRGQSAKALSFDIAKAVVGSHNPQR